MWQHLTFRPKYIFYQQEKKSHRGLYQENRVGDLENSSPVLSKMMSYFWPCDLRRCHVQINTTNIVLPRYYDHVYICLLVNIKIKTLCSHIQESGVVFENCLIPASLAQ